MAQGTVLCWLDIESQGKKSSSQIKKWDVTPEPVQDYQLRLAVYHTENVPREDVEGTSDVFVKAFLGDSDPRETDTHWRCSSGQACFNYRLLFDFQSP